MQWYYAQNDQQMGPVSDEQMDQLVADGQITAETYVWYEGLDGWKTFGEIAKVDGAAAEPAAPAEPQPRKLSLAKQSEPDPQPGATAPGPASPVVTAAAPQFQPDPAPCGEAQTAMILGIIGFFCFSVILGPIAISKAMSAKKQIAANPHLTGAGKATAGLVLGIIDTVFGVISIFQLSSAVSAVKEMGVF